MSKSRKSQENRVTGNDSGGITRVALVLDRSGSMEFVRNEAREAFNEAIDRVAEEAGKGGGATVTLVTFNHDVKIHMKNAPAEKAKKLGPTDYRPEGCTALFDAVGQAILALDEPGPLGPEDAALVLVVTDGQENSSKEVTQKQLVESIERLEKTGAWTFSFMCANVDIRDMAQQLGVREVALVGWEVSEGGAKMMGSDMRLGVSDYFESRRGGKRSIGSIWEKVTQKVQEKVISEK